MMCLLKFQERSEFRTKVLSKESTVFVKYFAMLARYTDVVDFNLIPIDTPNTEGFSLLPRNNNIRYFRSS